LQSQDKEGHAMTTGKASTSQNNCSVLNKRGFAQPVTLSNGGGGGSPSGKYMYEDPYLPQYSVWNPDIYLPLNGSLANEGCAPIAFAAYGAAPPVFVADSPFGSGQSLQFQPNSPTRSASGISALQNRANFQSGPGRFPWSFGTWFKLPPTTSAMDLVQSPTPFAADGIQLYVSGNPTFHLGITLSSAYMIQNVNYADGLWHQITYRQVGWTLGNENTDITRGEVWVDGVFVGYMFGSTWSKPAPFSGGPVTLASYGALDVTANICDWWYTNTAIPDNLPSLLWNGGTGARYSSAGLFELAKV